LADLAHRRDLAGRRRSGEWAVGHGVRAEFAARSGHC